MRILFDECLPGRKLTSAFPKHDTATVAKMGWASVQNGALLALAEPDFDAFITMDSNLRYQQNTPHVDLLIVVLRAHSNRLQDLMPLIPGIHETLKTGRAGEVVEVSVS